MYEKNLHKLPGFGQCPKKNILFSRGAPLPSKPAWQSRDVFLFPYSFLEKKGDLRFLRNFHYNQHILGPGTRHLENTAGITVVLNNKPFTVYVDVEERDSFSPVGGT